MAVQNTSLKSLDPVQFSQSLHRDYTRSQQNKAPWSRHISKSCSRPPNRDKLMAGVCGGEHVCPISLDIMSRPCSHTSSYHHKILPLQCGPTKQDEAAKRHRLLLVRLVNMKKTLEESKLRENLLVKSNEKLKQQINLEEDVCHQRIKNQLRRYEHLRAGSDNVVSIHKGDIKEARISILELRKQEENSIKELEDQVLTLDFRLKERAEFLELMSTYKDKEFYRKCSVIESLEQRLAETKDKLKEEEDQVTRVGKAALRKLKNIETTEASTIKDSVTKIAERKLDKSVPEMANENKHMEEEIRMHKMELTKLEESISSLQREIEILERDPRRNFHRTVFPELLCTTLPKCTPDMDVVFDIPTHETLPI